MGVHDNDCTADRPIGVPSKLSKAERILELALEFLAMHRLGLPPGFTYGCAMLSVA